MITEGLRDIERRGRSCNTGVDTPVRHAGRCSEKGIGRGGDLLYLFLFFLSISFALFFLGWHVHSVLRYSFQEDGMEMGGWR